MSPLTMSVPANQARNEALAHAHDTGGRRDVSRGLASRRLRRPGNETSSAHAGTRRREARITSAAVHAVDEIHIHLISKTRAPGRTACTEGGRSECTWEVDRVLSVGGGYEVGRLKGLPPPHGSSIAEP